MMQDFGISFLSRLSVDQINLEAGFLMECSHKAVGSYC